MIKITSTKVMSDPKKLQNHMIHATVSASHMQSLHAHLLIILTRI